jgi:hypothetical protein
MNTTSDLAVDAEPPRYRCTACGNLTRFEVTVLRRTRSFHHFTVGGELSIEDLVVLDEDYESVLCRWCGTGASVVIIQPDQIQRDPTDGETLGADAGV